VAAATRGGHQKGLTTKEGEQCSQQRATTIADQQPVTPQESDRPAAHTCRCRAGERPTGRAWHRGTGVNMEAASTAQRDLIANLADRLRLRNVDPWAEDLTKQDARELIGQLNLRRISARLKRPVTVDASDAEAVRRELARLEQLDDAHHTRHARAASKHLAGEGPKPQTLPSRRVQVTPMPQPKLTAKQESDRRVAMDRGPIVPVCDRPPQRVDRARRARLLLAATRRVVGRAPRATDPDRPAGAVDRQSAGREGDHTAVAGTVEQAGAEIEEAQGRSRARPPRGRPLTLRTCSAGPGRGRASIQPGCSKRRDHLAARTALQPLEQ